jgi:hypothetical protein
MRSILQSFLEQVLAAIYEAEKAGGASSAKLELAREAFKRLSPLPDAADGALFDIAVDIVVIVLDLTDGWPDDVAA